MYKDSKPTAIDQCVILRDVYFYGIDESCFGLVLTPTCDFAQNKAEFIQLCALFPAWEFVTSLLHNEWSKFNVPSKKAEVKSKIKDIIKQKLPRYHWFSPLQSLLPPFIGDFQITTSLTLKDLESQEMIAELESPYREQVPSRYSAYMGRVGTPDFSESDIQTWLDKGVDEIFLNSKLGA